MNRICFLFYDPSELIVIVWSVGKPDFLFLCDCELKLVNDLIWDLKSLTLQFIQTQFSNSTITERP